MRIEDFSHSDKNGVVSYNGRPIVCATKGGWAIPGATGLPKDLYRAVSGAVWSVPNDASAGVLRRAITDRLFGAGHGGGGAKTRTKADRARLTRPSPTAHAADHKGECKRGHDGHLWCSEPDKNRVFRWKRVR